MTSTSFLKNMKTCIYFRGLPSEVGLHTHAHTAALKLPLRGLSLRHHVPDRWTSASLCGTNTLETPIDKMIMTKTHLGSCIENVIKITQC